MARKGTSKLKGCESEIEELLRQGKTFQQITDYLFDNKGIEISTTAVFLFVRNNGLKSRVQKGRHDNPVCFDCEHYQEFKTTYIASHAVTGKRRDVRVCKACNECIPMNVVTSPEFCPKRT